MNEYQNFLDWLRHTLAALSVIVAILLAIGAVRHWKRLGIGQKLWATGAVLILVYVADANQEAAALDLPFRWRIVPLSLGLIAYFAYILEPSGRKNLRFGSDPYAGG